MARKSPTDTEADAPDGRDQDLLSVDGVQDKLTDAWADVEKGFQDQTDRANETMDYWDCYNCKLGEKQFYNGNSQVFVPIIANAVNARKTRYTNQIFPQSGRYVEVTTEDGTLPQAIMSLLENYVKKAKLRTKVMPALCLNGDIEGQYSVYVEWLKRRRHVAMRVKKPVEVGEGEDSLPVPGEEVDDMHEEVIDDGYPSVEVIADADILVLPATADSAEDAIAEGGSVTILRRWGKAKIRALIKDKQIDKEAGEDLIKEMVKKQPGAYPSKAKQMVDAAGIKGEGDGIKHALVYETWLNLKVDGEMRLCRAYYAGSSDEHDHILGCRVNPLWCDRLPILSVPARKVQGSFKGQSPIKQCADMQYAANDAVNEGFDSAAYSLMPIVMTDPEKNPRVGSMVLALAAVWETSPQDTQFAQFPPLWKDAFELVGSCKAEIATALQVSPVMLTQQSSKKKLNQAEIASEQQIELLTTADVVTVIEEGILTPMMVLFAEMDHQYRDKPLSIRQNGAMGVRAVMEDIPPLQMENRYQFMWFGVEAAKSAQQIQQGISAINVVMNIDPSKYPGYQLDLSPAIVQLMESAFGPRIAPLVFKDLKSQQTLDPTFENSLLSEGIAPAVHPTDDDAKHLQVHMQALQMGDLSGEIRAHIMRHTQAMQMKAAAAMQQQGMQGGQMGSAPQGGPSPMRSGAQPRMIRGNQQPPGAVHKDQMVDPARVPR